MNPWFQIFPSRNPRSRLVCFPRAGGTAADYAAWGKALVDEVQVCALQLPGRRRRFAEPALRTVPQIVNKVAGALRDLTDLPLVLFGDCMGAILAYEIARQLRRANALLPASLVVCSYPGPDINRTSPNVHDAPIETFRQRLVEVGGVPAEVVDDDELFSLLLPTLRADFEVFETYKYTPEPPLDLNIYAIIGETDPHVPCSMLEGWRAHTCRNFAMRTFVGGHFFLKDNIEVIDMIREITWQAPDLEENAR